MQSGLSSTDRKLMWGAAALAVLLLASIAVFAPSATGQGTAVPSSYDSTSGGALAAYLLLTDLHYPVRRWEEAPTALRSPGAGSLLILADPTDPPSTEDRAALQRYVQSGGHVLFSGATIGIFFQGARSVFPNLNPEWKAFRANFPSSVSRAADKIVMRPVAFWGGLTESQIPLYGERDLPVVVSWKMGRGEILWWAGATPLTNAGISQAGNLRLFLNSMDAAGRDPSSVIYWDEYFHGARGSLWGYVQKTPLPWACVQLTIFVVAVLFTFSRRSGPIFTPAPASRLSPLEFVDTMGGLYQRAGAAAIPIEVSYRRLRRGLARRLGFAPTVDDSELALAARQRLGMEEQIGEVLRDASLHAKLPKVPARQALSLVRRMEGYLVQLRTPHTHSQEKN
ncbi:MAG TPA: DUF4350 domain-containing protein [Bryobacteraceae bacterium]|nr:DUF4350 domain-containing protein [Bryobacteraceae bacterium]